MSERREERFLSTIITGVVTNGVVLPTSPLPEGAPVEIHLKEGRPEVAPGAAGRLTLRRVGEDAARRAAGGSWRQRRRWQNKTIATTSTLPALTHSVRKKSITTNLL